MFGLFKKVLACSKFGLWKTSDGYLVPVVCFEYRYVPGSVLLKKIS
jgi:hypothetical protein